MVVGWWFGRQFLDGVEGGGAIFRCLGARPGQFWVEFSIGVDRVWSGRPIPVSGGGSWAAGPAWVWVGRPTLVLDPGPGQAGPCGSTKFTTSKSLILDYKFVLLLVLFFLL